MQNDSSATAAVLSTHTPILFESAVERAAELLRNGDVVAVPTETVYGLAANALDAAAVHRIYEVKGRPSTNPVIVHVATLDMALRCVAHWNKQAGQLALAFWPGPLTIVLPASKEIPGTVTAGGSTVGVRWPSHPFMQALIRRCGFPLAAPSANLSNHVSPTSADHVSKQLGNRIRLIVDGGQSQVGIESTVVDLSAAPPRVLRPGMIHDEALVSVIGELRTGAGPSSAVLKSPGLLPKHYAPVAKLVLWSWNNDQDLNRLAVESGHPPPGIHVIAHSHIPSFHGFGRVSVIPHDPAAFARALYAELHACDEAGAGLIVIEHPPDELAWRGILDRLRRASSP